MRADPDKLVHRAQRSHHRPFFHGHVTGQGSAVYQHDAVADHTIMSHMGVSHDQSMAADASDAAALRCTPIEGNVLPDYVMVADLQPRLFTFICCVLRFTADSAERKEPVVRTNSGHTGDQHETSAHSSHPAQLHCQYGS